MWWNILLNLGMNMAASPKHKQITKHFRKSNGFEKDHNDQKDSSPRSSLGTQASSCMAFSLEPHLGRILKLTVGKKICWSKIVVRSTKKCWILLFFNFLLFPRLTTRQLNYKSLVTDHLVISPGKGLFATFSIQECWGSKSYNPLESQIHQTWR